jgi:hypothetical protein
LYLSDRLEQGHIAPTKALVQYLGLQEGPTQTLVFTAVLDHRGLCSRDPTVLNYIIEIVYDLLKHGNFKVCNFLFFVISVLSFFYLSNTYLKNAVLIVMYFVCPKCLTNQDTI